MIVKALKERTSTSSQGEDLDDVITSLKKKLDAKVKTIRIKGNFKWKERIVGFRSNEQRS